MKIRNLLFVLLSAAFFACGSDADMQPELVSPAGTAPPPPTGFNIATNFSLVGSTGKEAEMSFGVNPVMDQDLTIKVNFFARNGSTGNFTQIPSPYNDVTIPAYSSLSAYSTVKTEDFPICWSNATVKMVVAEVRYGGQLIPARDYNVLGMNSDGSTQLEMVGTGYCGGSGQPGDVDADKFGDKLEIKLSTGDIQWGSGGGPGSYGYGT